MSVSRITAVLRSRRLAALPALAAALILATGVAAAHGHRAFLDRFHTVTSLASTVPANGDVNPYGITIVPRTSGKLIRGDILVSNFNNQQNLQGTGTTIDEISPGGSLKLFARISAAKLPGACPGGVGLTTALVALRDGYVIVGSLPTSDGMSPTAKAGCLIVLDHSGTVVSTIAGSPINGPWDMTAVDRGASATLFVTNVLNGTVAAQGATVNKGTVVRIELRSHRGSAPSPTAMTVIANGFPERTDPAALVVGPTGVAFSPGDGDSAHHGGHHGDQGGGTLYVADTAGNRIASIPDALTRTTPFTGGGSTVSSGGALNGPLGLTLAPGGDLIAANGGDGKFVELTPSGAQVASPTVDPAGAGVLFGLTVVHHRGVYFVDDGDNTLRLLH